MHPFTRILFILLAIASLGWSIYRDRIIEKEYTGDLRNRIVGSRLQKDGKLPYFYKWHPGDSTLYYDPQNFDSLKVSNITATPFFHQLLYPLAELPQRTISKIWLWIEYFLMLSMAAMAFYTANSRPQKIITLFFLCLFLYTNAWTGHIAAGQLYLFIPFLCWIFYCLLSTRQTLYKAILAGVTLAVLVLLRPNSILFFLPFLLLIHRFSTRFKALFTIGGILVILLSFSNSRTLSYWNDYRNALAEQLKSHQQLHPASQLNAPDPHYQQWEGWNLNNVESTSREFPYQYNMEHGNVFVLVNHAFHTKLPVSLLAIASGASMFMLALIWHQKNKPLKEFPIAGLAILGFCLYMISDFFSPIHRFQYNGVQWLFPLLLATSLYNPAYRKLYIFMAIGLLLNSLNLDFMVMEQTLGEGILFAALIALILSRQPINEK